MISILLIEILSKTKTYLTTQQWSILVNAPYALGKNVYAAVSGGGVYKC